MEKVVQWCNRNCDMNAHPFPLQQWFSLCKWVLECQPQSVVLDMWSKVKDLNNKNVDINFSAHDGQIRNFGKSSNSVIEATY